MFKSKYTVGDLRDFLMNSKGDGLTLDIPNKLSGGLGGYVFIIDVDPNEHVDDDRVYIYNPSMRHELWLAINIYRYYIKISQINDSEHCVYAKSNELEDDADLDALFKSYLDDFKSSCALRYGGYCAEEEKIEEFAQFLERCIDMYKVSNGHLTQLPAAIRKSLLEESEELNRKLLDENTQLRSQMAAMLEAESQ